MAQSSRHCAGRSRPFAALALVFAAWPVAPTCLTIGTIHWRDRMARAGLFWVLLLMCWRGRPNMLRWRRYVEAPWGNGSAIFAALACIAGLAAVCRACPQDYPNCLIRVVVGFSAESGADITARVVGHRMGQLLGQQIVVENKTGAGSSLAAESSRALPRTARRCCWRLLPFDQRGDELEPFVQFPRALCPDRAVDHHAQHPGRASQQYVTQPSNKKGAPPQLLDGS